MSERVIRLGTRGSDLALWQARQVAAALGRAGARAEIVTIDSLGDRDRTIDLAAAPERGVFTAAIERALLDAEVDAAVHSLKDLPTSPTPGARTAAVLPRGPVGDVLLANQDAVDEEAAALPLRPGTVVGTGAPRRRALLAEARTDLTTPEIFRGNVATRLAKAAAGDVGAVVLARAGLERLGIDPSPLRAFDLLPERWLPAPGQGAIAVTVRDDDDEAAELVGATGCEATTRAVDAERGLLVVLEAGCHAAVGAWCRGGGGALRLSAGGLAPDGRWRAVHLDALDSASAIAESARAVRGERGADPCPDSPWWQPVEPWWDATR